MSTATADENMVTMGIRLTREQRERLDAIARRQCNTTGGIIRLAIQQLVENEPAAKRALKRQQKAA